MRYLYGATDEKHVRADPTVKYVTRPTQQIKKRKSPLDTYRFRLDPSLRSKPKINRYETSIRYKVTPDTLVELCSNQVNKLPLPKPFKWTILDTTDWIRKLGFPQYQNTFKKNFIDGRDLITMDASNLVKINIKKFDHIKIITNAIRKMYGFDKSSFRRSISLPDRTPGAQYKFFRVFNGPKYEKTRRTQLFRSRHLLRPPPLYETHWQTLERWLRHERPVDTELFGGYRRHKDYMYHPPKDRRVPKVTQKFKPCDCMPPCMCNWTDKQLRSNLTLKCLGKVREPKPLMISCKCKQPCTCDWPLIQKELCLSILKRHFPHKYGSELSRRSYIPPAHMPVFFRHSLTSF